MTMNELAKELAEFAIRNSEILSATADIDALVGMGFDMEFVLSRPKPSPLKTRDLAERALYYFGSSDKPYLDYLTAFDLETKKLKEDGGR